MRQTLDRREAVRVGLLATIGVGALGALSDRAAAAVGAPSQNEAVVGRCVLRHFGARPTIPP